MVILQGNGYLLKLKTKRRNHKNKNKGKNSPNGKQTKEPKKFISVLSVIKKGISKRTALNAGMKKKLVEAVLVEEEIYHI